MAKFFLDTPAPCSYYIYSIPVCTIYSWSLWKSNFSSPEDSGPRSFAISLRDYARSSFVIDYPNILPFFFSKWPPAASFSIASMSKSLYLSSSLPSKCVPKKSLCFSSDSSGKPWCYPSISLLFIPSSFRSRPIPLWALDYFCCSSCFIFWPSYSYKSWSLMSQLSSS